VNKRLRPTHLADVKTVEHRLLTVSHNTLRMAYEHWAFENDYPVTTKHWLGKNLKSVLPELKYDKKKKLYEGIDLIEKHLYPACSV